MGWSHSCQAGTYVKQWHEQLKVLQLTGIMVTTTSWHPRTGKRQKQRSAGAPDWLNSFIILKKFFLTYSFLRDREWVEERQRERNTRNLKQAPGSELSARCSNSDREIMTWVKVRCSTIWAPGRPMSILTHTWIGVHCAFSKICNYIVFWNSLFRLRPQIW